MCVFVCVCVYVCDFAGVGRTCAVELFCGVFVCGCLRVQLCYATVLHGRVDVVLSGSLDVQSVRVVSVTIVVPVRGSVADSIVRSVA